MNALRQQAKGVMWAITGLYAQHEPQTFFYTGTYLTRRDALRRHGHAQGRKWTTCYRRGDRAVKVQITEIVSDG